MEKQRECEVQRTLEHWAVEALARWARASAPSGTKATAPPAWLSAYGKLLSSNWAPDGRGERLLSVFGLIKTENPEWQPTAVNPRRLSLEGLLEGQAETPDALWAGFEQEYERLPTGAGRFETFGYLMQKYAWAAPCTYGDEYLSLYEEFKALAALVYASDGAETPAETVLLIGGDIPGIQDFVYTITSKGAAKGLRGRSFFLQLLGDAVVRRLIAELGLCWANVVYEAGGNLNLLAPDRPETLRQVCQIRQQVNEVLLQAFQGDMSLVLEYQVLPTAALFDAEQFVRQRQVLGTTLARAKHMPLGSLLGDWDKVFEPQGEGSERSCRICRVEIDERNSVLMEPTEEAIEGSEEDRVCCLCDSFGRLARAIRHENLWMAVKEWPGLLGTAFEPDDRWYRLLARMTGFTYAFGKDRPGDKGQSLLVNRFDFLQQGACGFRVMANVTPVVTQDDVDYLREEEHREPAQLLEPGKDIRDFGLLARAATERGAIERVGVLQMDMDGLGHTFSNGVPELTMPRLSALSAAFGRYMGGCLTTLARQYGGNDLYIIYAGGDDLFIVGAWDCLPDLAHAIQTRLKDYTGDHPVLSFSGGLILEGKRFPLYRAAERSKDAEHAAKDYKRDNGRGKEAFSFLGTVVGWEEWPQVVASQQILRDLVKQGVPHSLLHLAQTFHKQWHDQKLKASSKRQVWGRWMWMSAYSLARLAHGESKEDSEMIWHIQQEWIESSERIHYLGLAARWAEYLLRGGEK